HGRGRSRGHPRRAQPGPRAGAGPCGKRAARPRDGRPARGAAAQARRSDRRTLNEACVLWLLPPPAGVRMVRLRGTAARTIRTLGAHPGPDGPGWAARAARSWRLAVGGWWLVASRIRLPMNRDMSAPTNGLGSFCRAAILHLRPLPCSTACATFALSLNYDHGGARNPGVQVRLAAGSPMETERSHLNPGFKVVSQASACAEDVSIPVVRRHGFRRGAASSDPAGAVTIARMLLRGSHHER